jgi:hypothetical protein
MNNKTLQIDYYDSFTSIEKEWEEIYSASSSLSYFASLNWHKVVLEFFCATHLTKRIFSLHYYKVNCAANPNVFMIGFFFFNKVKKSVHFSHLLGPSDYYEFLSTETFDNELVLQTFSLLKHDFKAEKIFLNHIKDETLVHAIKTKFKNALVNEVSCVGIAIPEDKDIYLDSLSKNVRQNIRTAYNRLDRDGKNIRMFITDALSFNCKEFLKLRDLYFRRNSSKKQVIHWKSKCYQTLDYLFQRPKDLFETKALFKQNYTLVKLQIDNEIAAYFFGFKNNTSMVVNRVVINDKFKFYSPGLLLISTFIQDAKNTDLTYFDLTVGDEKYKFDLGGTIHSIFNITI